MRFVGYFPQWGIYDRHYFVRDVHASGQAARLTHLTYAFGELDESGRCVMTEEATGDAWADYQRRFSASESVDGRADKYEQPLAGNFNQLRKLKARHPRLKIGISFGGWNASRYFSNAALTAESRAAFASSAVSLYFDGDLPVAEGEPQGGPGAAAGIFDAIDFDWEWPGSGGNEHNVVRDADRHNFTLLLAETRRQLDAFTRRTGRPVQMSAYLPADRERVAAGIEPEVFRYLDFGIVQGYDFHGDWDLTTNHASQLYTPPDDPSPCRLSVDAGVLNYLEMGVPPAKLLVGLPGSGRGWRGVPVKRNGLYQQARGIAAGSWGPGSEDYRTLVRRPGERFRDREYGALWLYDGDEFWSYDDPELVRQKAAYAKDLGLGGLSLWSLDNDDSHGSLVRAMHG
ncbi:glycoside hydrolase family 18 protein [Marinitenerispora sediminis]|uniref:chitinase n=1 Tax=Marinitenerispora sediminis TaxID=1931232 RepID=A0A368T415_9ACTN|nr:glycoside hydrolase family 18 protein [Marinitenerispora sediminis]RCV49777.1 glycosyl hydrolase [Marinitenerispora sediminis]RCV57146.1 glycosyl hydrolase [Marinitenerispora sediminis]RCV57877.1 glycosyl hydrolase [Marinitenerispora sediminis]